MIGRVNVRRAPSRHRADTLDVEGPRHDAATQRRRAPAPGLRPLDPSPRRPRLARLRLPTRATGPRTVAGKARSRANAVKHGLRCQVVEPPDQREKIADRVAEWTDAIKPADPVQRWLVARAATASVRLDRCVERENLALEENTARAERDFFRRRRAWARRLGARLRRPARKVYAKLTARPSVATG